MRKLLTSLLLVLITLPVFSQSVDGQLKVTLVDKKTRSPLSYGVVVVKQNGIAQAGGQTDEKGEILVANLSPGDYLVYCNYVGYKEGTSNSVRVDTNEITFLTIEMELEGDVGSVVIMSSSPKLVETDAGTTGETYKRKQIKKLPHRGVNSISSISGGVFSQHGSSPIFRGNRSSGTVYYVDGQRVAGTPNLPQGSIESQSTMLGGIPAEYGDAEDMKKNDLSHPTDPQKVTSGNKRHKQFADSLRFEPITTHNEFSVIVENQWKSSRAEALSTFSIDVDKAAYSNIRNYIMNGQIPPKDAVRLEEMINYFHYDYTQPSGQHPFNVITEVADCPWNSGHKLVQIALQGKNIVTDSLPPAHLVFLIDVSGSMGTPNKLPLVKETLKLLVAQLRPHDRVAIVVYAGAAGLVLPSTTGDKKEKILEAINKLEAGGSTAGGQGIELAYSIAKEYFLKGANNRVILATDGDFNVGVSDVGGLQHLIEEKRKSGIFLTALGYGMGNYKDNTLETLADKGNGNYAYIDNLQEAKKVVVKEFAGTLYAIAKDVKLQVEWNPAVVKSYRLLGYENRLLNVEDFNNDAKDAGELGAGHTVTALYEIILTGSDEETANIAPLKYQQQTPNQGYADEMLTVNLRYKKPDGDTSTLISYALKGQTSSFDQSSINLRWAAAVASYGMLLRESEFRGETSYELITKWAKSALGEDKEGYRKEFLQIINKTGALVDVRAQH